MATNRPSNEDAPRVPGEEGSGRRRPILWAVLGLILLLLLALLVPFACQALRGTGDQGSGNGGSGTGAGGAQTEEAQGGKPDTKQDAAQGGGSDGTGQSGARGNTDAQGEQNAGSGAPQDGVDAALIDAPDRVGDGTALTIPEATLKGGKGWLAVRAADGGRPGAVLGHAALKEGKNSGVRVQLDRPVNRSQKLYAMIHADDPGDGNYTFPDGDPPVLREGEMAVEPLYYTLSAAASGGENVGAASGGQAGIQGGELPESGGIPSAFLLAAGAAMLLSCLTCLSLTLRRGSVNGT
jgi:hypothetical protein